MDIHWFFDRNVAPGLFYLDGDESNHCIRVLRLKVGNELAIIDGSGNKYVAVIIDDNPRKCLVEVASNPGTELRRSFFIHIALAPPKNIQRFEWFLEKATEIGVDIITPLICHHSERNKLNTDRFEKILVAAIKQSQQLWLPQLNELTDFNIFIREKLIGQKFIAYVDEKNNTELKDAYRSGESATILIGPEGDFSKDEIDRAISFGYLPISLGKNRLRTETAAMVACHTINLLNA